MNDFNRNLGFNIAQARDRAGMTQAYLAAMAGASISLQNKIESGQTGISAERLCKYAQILRVPISFLTGFRSSLEYSLHQIIEESGVEPWYWYCRNFDVAQYAAVITVETMEESDQLPPSGSELTMVNGQLEKDGIKLSQTRLIWDSFGEDSKAIARFFATAYSYLLQPELEDVYCSDDESIHNWFELSYAQYLTIPRSVLQSMPKRWQARFVNCLNELDSSIDWRPEPGRQYFVSLHEVEESWAGGENELECETCLHEITDPLADYDRGRRRIALKNEQNN